jgi:hypothetical protein
MLAFQMAEDILKTGMNEGGPESVGSDDFLATFWSVKKYARCRNRGRSEQDKQLF